MGYRLRLPAIVACSILSILVFAPRSSAQPVGRRGGIELGASAGALVILPSFGGRVSVPLHPRVAVEGTVEYVPLTFEEDRSRWLLFQGQLRHRLTEWRSWNVHATYGATVFVKYRSVAESRQTRPDGSVLVFPGYRQLRRYDPPGVHAGIGGERTLSAPVVFRWDVQVLLPIGRLSIPIPRAVVGFAWRPGARQ